jgi:MFS family permease
MFAFDDPNDQLAAAIASPTVLTVLATLGVLLLVVVFRELRQVQANLLVLMAAAFLDMAGLFMVVPLIPFYVEKFGVGASLFGLPLAEGTLTGLVVSAYTVAQLLSAPWWGRCSDRWGRRPVLLVALVASSSAFLLFGFAESLLLLVASRVVQGLGGGTTGVIQAYVGDAVEPAQRARALGWLSAATNLGVALGPVLGSLAVTLGEHDLLPGASELRLGHAAPGVAAALLCLLNAGFAWVYLREPVAASAKPKPQVKVREAIDLVLQQPRAPASRLLLIYGISIGAAQGVNPTMILLLGERFGATEQSVGYLFMYIGALSVFARILVLGRAVDRFGEPALSTVGLVTLAAGIGLLGIVGSVPTLAIAVAMLPLGSALTFPCLTSMLSRVVPAGDRGLYMGLQQTFGGVARLLAPLAYGFAYDYVGRAAPFELAAAFVGISVLLGLGLARVVPPKNAPAPKA